MSDDVNCRGSTNAEVLAAVYISGVPSRVSDGDVVNVSMRSPESPGVK